MLARRYGSKTSQRSTPHSKQRHAERLPPDLLRALPLLFPPQCGGKEPAVEERSTQRDEAERPNLSEEARRAQGCGRATGVSTKEMKTTREWNARSLRYWLQPTNKTTQRGKEKGRKRSREKRVCGGSVSGTRVGERQKSSELT